MYPPRYDKCGIRLWSPLIGWRMDLCGILSNLVARIYVFCRIGWRKPIITNPTQKSKLYLTPQKQSSVSVTLMASTFTAFFSLLFLLSIPSILSHPLDPLTPLEIKQVAKIIKESRAFLLANLTFQYVGLDEPSKSTILLWLSNPTKEPPPRQAFVIARAYGKSYEFVVSLSHGSIISQHIYNGTGFPLLNLEEQSAANDLAFNYPPFIKSIKKRGLDIKDVVPSVFTVGWYGEKSMSGRVVKVLFFYKGGTPNVWVRPIEGVAVLVDLDKMVIVKYSDSEVVPIPKAEGTEYRGSKLRPPFAAETKPITVVQPHGPSFKINGHTIR